MEACNGQYYLVRMSTVKGDNMKMYVLNKKRTRVFNQKYLKRSKNQKDGFQVLVSNGHIPFP